MAEVTYFKKSNVYDLKAKVIVTEEQEVLLHYCENDEDKYLNLNEFFIELEDEIVQIKSIIKDY